MYSPYSQIFLQTNLGKCDYLVEGQYDHMSVEGDDCVKVTVFENGHVGEKDKIETCLSVYFNSLLVLLQKS